jgi:hypothetical protein
MPRKVFTAGEVLAAADVNEFLMDQSVQSFAGTAARGSAIPSPVTGMTTYLEDTKNLEIYDGSSYTSPSGMTLLAASSPSAAGTVTINNLFSASYQTYKIYFNLVGSTSAGLSAQLVASGTPAESNYAWQYFEASGTSTDADRIVSDASFAFGAVRSAGPNFGTIELSNPFVAAETSYTSYYQDNVSAAAIQLRSGRNSNATSYDGLRIFPSTGTMTGSIRIYGVRN